MGAAKVLLKAILIPVIIFLVVVAIAVFLIMRHRDRKRKEKDIENHVFQPHPPITQWGTGPQPTSSPSVPVQKPDAVAYPMQYPYETRGVVG